MSLSKFILIPISEYEDLLEKVDKRDKSDFIERIETVLKNKLLDKKSKIKKIIGLINNSLGLPKSPDAEKITLQEPAESTRDLLDSEDEWDNDLSSNEDYSVNDDAVPKRVGNKEAEQNQEERKENEDREQEEQAEKEKMSPQVSASSLTSQKTTKRKVAQENTENEMDRNSEGSMQKGPSSKKIAKGEVSGTKQNTENEMARNSEDVKQKAPSSKKIAKGKVSATKQNQEERDVLPIRKSNRARIPLKEFKPHWHLIK